MGQDCQCYDRQPAECLCVMRYDSGVKATAFVIRMANCTDASLGTGEFYGQEGLGEFQFAVDDEILQLRWVRALQLCGAQVLPETAASLAAARKKNKIFDQECASMQKVYKRLAVEWESKKFKGQEEIQDELAELNAAAKNHEIKMATAALEKATKRRQKKKVKALEAQIAQLTEPEPEQ